MADARRLVELGAVPGLAREIAAQIDAGVGDKRRLIELAVVPRLALEIANQITAKTGDKRRLVELGVVGRLASELATQIQGGGGQPPAASTEYDFSALPAGFSFSSAAGRRYTNSARKMRWSEQNTPRLHHAADGTFLGMLFEKGHKFDCRLKTNPTSNSGAFSGGQPANITFTSDPAVLAGLNLLGAEQIYTSVWQIDNTAGSSTFSIQVVATTGDTLVRSIRYIGKTTANGGSAGAFTSGNSIANSALSQSNTWEEVVFNGFTPTSGARLITLTVPAGHMLWIAQVDQIQTIDAPQPLRKDVEPSAAYFATPDTMSRNLKDINGYSTNEMVLRVQFYQAIRFAAASEVIFSITDEDDPTTYLEGRGGANNTIEVEYVLSGVSQFLVTGLPAVKDDVNALVVRMKNGAFAAAANGVMGISAVNTGIISAALDKLNINVRGANSGNSLMQKMRIASMTLNDNQIAAASVVASMGVI